MNEEDPPPHRMKKYTEFDSQEDFRESVIDDIRYFESMRIPEDGEYMSHMISSRTNALVDYLKEKLGIDESEI